MSLPVNDLRDVFLDKPELVWPLPEWMLPGPELERLRGRAGLAVVELAGRDSVAAALRAVDEGGLSALLPTYVYTGTEHGPFGQVTQAHQRLARRLPPGVELSPLLVFGSPDFWRALNGRFLGELMTRHGFSTACVGCHVYLHALRLPLAMALGGAPIIAGERLSHDGRTKVNQVASCLEAYRGLAADFGVELRLPLAKVARGAEIETILGLNWPEGGDQLGCALSGNYNDPRGQARWHPEGLTRFLEGFALPLARRVLAAYLAGDQPDHLALAKDILTSRA
ncbi:MAG: hypothetical protein V1806_12035 [Pseudomonadota bacterium]